MVLRALHLCSGYAGFELALRLAGIPARTVGHVERDAYAAATLVARMAETKLDQAPVWSDLETFDARAWRGRVDLVTAGFPCQPWSAAGQRRGVDDERWLWPDIARIVRDIRPRYVILENVRPLLVGGIGPVLGDLADCGFDAEWSCLSAGQVGAPHERDRLWILAYTDEHRSQGVGRQPGHNGHAWRDVDGSGGPHVGDAGRPRRPENPGSTPADESGDARRPADGGHVADRPSEDVADAHGARLPLGAQPRLESEVTGTDGHGPSHGWIGRFPPGPDDRHGWERWTAEGGPQPGVRRDADGRPPWLADALHLGGNGLVPVVAATAIRLLARRAHIEDELIGDQ